MAHFSVNANLNEYMFARIIEDHNIAVREGRSAGDYITSSQGRALHDRWLDAVGSQVRERRDLQTGEYHPVLDADGNPTPLTLDTIPQRQSRMTLQSVFRTVNGIDADIQSDTAFAEKCKSYMQEYIGVTGIALEGDALRARQANGVAFTDKNMIPCSPFEGQYANRETILNHGTEILYRKPDDVFVQRAEPFQNGQRFVFVERGLSLEAERQRGDLFYQMRCRNSDGSRAKADEKTGIYDFRDVGAVSTTADAAGLSRFRGYMTDKEFREATTWCASVPESNRASASMVERGVAILEYLKDSGIPYSIKADTNPGQLKAVISNTKVSIRVTDTRVPGKNDRENGMYIGRVYADGDSMYLRARSASDAKDYTPSIDDTLKLVAYGLGRSVERPASISSSRGNVGSISLRRDRGDGNTMRRSTYLMPKAPNARTGQEGGKLQLIASFGTKRNEARPFRKDAKGKMVPNNMFLGLDSSNNHSNSHMVFATPESAEEFLRNAVATARDNFEQRVNIDYLVQEHLSHPLSGEPDDPNLDYVPTLSGDQTISPAQLTYWNVLRGRGELEQPEDSQTFRDNDPVFGQLFESMNLDDGDGFDFDSEDDGLSQVPTTYDPFTGRNKYVGTPEENIRAHLRDSVDLMFGNFEPDANGIRFSPSFVAQFMESAHGMPRNKDNIVAAMRTLEFTGEEVRGNDFETGTMKDKLLRFDETTAVPMVEKAKDSPFMQAVLDTVVTSLRETACEVDPADVKIDNMGVIHYTAKAAVGQDASRFVPLEREIGQIFEPDADGLVETHYNGSKNKLITPGYNVYLTPPTEGQNESVESRYRFRGLPQVLIENIQSRIRYDVQDIEEDLPYDLSKIPDDMTIHTGTTTSVNNTYRGLYHTSYKIVIPQAEKEDGSKESLKETYMRQMQMTNMPEDRLRLIFRTNRGICHFPKELIEESSVNAEYRFKQKEASKDFSSVHELTNDNGHDLYAENGHSNFAITAENSDRLFDPVMTGSGKNQGVIRYFMVGAGVDFDGKPHFADDPNGRAPIMSAPEMRYASYIPADRQQMAVQNLMSGSGIAGAETIPNEETGEVRLKGVGVAFLNAGGYTYDDGAIISKDLAEKYQQLDEKGNLRPLMPGDKICDSSGNKSIVGLVVDRNMDPKEAERKGISDIVQLFKDNPTLDVVQAPYSPCSRFNAAAAKFGLENHGDLKLPNGNVVEGGIAYMPITITHHTAEDHTKSYDEDDVKQGKGRKVSAQQGWMFTAKGADALMAEYFGPNSTVVVNMREYLNTLGWDFSESGNMRFGYAAHNGEERYVFHMPYDETLKDIETKDLGKLFGDTVGSRGGFMELPFSLNMMARNPSSNQAMTTAELDGVSRNGHPMYGLPVMSAHLRSGQTFEDGTKMTHDYTNQYQNIYEKGIAYLKAESELANAATDEEKAKLEKTMSDSRKSAQQSYNMIMDDVYSRIFDAKHNIFRDSIMARRMSKSATAVWTPDPSLDLHQIGLSPGLADKLGVKNGERVLVARDPLLRTYGMRYMEVSVDPEIHGCSVNPAMAVSFEGDFDGDSVAIQSVQTEAGKAEAYRLFSFEQNMLDFSRVRENGDYALMFNDSMDIISNEAEDGKRHAAQVAQFADQYGVGTPEYQAAVDALPEPLKDKRMRIEHEFNEVYRDTSLSDDERAKKNEALLKELSDYSHQAFAGVGAEALSFKSPEALMSSLIHIVDNKAKGSMKKLTSYMNYGGLTADKDADGRILPNTVKDVGSPLVDHQTICDVEKSTAIKAHCTGNAGAVSQRMVSFFRNVASEFGEDVNPAFHGGLESGLRVSYLATQGILQAKHDPVKAQILEDKINSDIRNLWKGYALEEKQVDGVSVWRVKYDKGVPVQARPTEWVRTFMAVHEDPNGLDLGGSINKEDVEKIAKIMTGPDGRMLNIEDPEVIKKYVSPIDQMAYYQTDGKTRDLLNEMASSNRNLFEGSASYQFAPDQIRRNIQLEQDGRVDEMKAIQPADTRVVHNTIDVHHSVIELSMQTSENQKAFRGKDVVSTSFDPSVQAVAAGKGSTFKYDFTKSGEEATIEPVKTETAVAEPVKPARKYPDISGVKADSDIEDVPNPV